MFLLFVDQSFCFLRLTSWDEIDLGNMMFRICWLLEFSSPIGVLSWFHHGSPVGCPGFTTAISVIPFESNMMRTQHTIEYCRTPTNIFSGRVEMYQEAGAMAAWKMLCYWSWDKSEAGKGKSLISEGFRSRTPQGQRRALAFAIRGKKEIRPCCFKGC